MLRVDEAVNIELVVFEFSCEYDSIVDVECGGEGGLLFSSPPEGGGEGGCKGLLFTSSPEGGDEGGIKLGFDSIFNISMRVACWEHWMC